MFVDPIAFTNRKVSVIPGSTSVNINNSNTVTIIAGETVGYPRVIMSDPLGTGTGFLFNPLTAKSESFLGITTSSITIGNIMKLQISGILTYIGWGLTVGIQYVNTLGLISNIPTSSGLSIIVGTALTPDKLFIRSAQNILL